MNKYYSAIKASVTKQKAIKQRSFYNAEKKLASWNDVCWIKSCKKTCKDLNIYFTNPYKVSKSDKATDYNKDQLLVEIAGDLAKLYAIDILSKKGIKQSFHYYFNAAKKFLSYFKGEIWQIRQVDLDKYIKTISTETIPRTGMFIDYCHTNGFISKTVRFNYSSKRDHSNEAAINRNDEKMPDTQSILACGSIFHNIVPHQKKLIKEYNNIRNCFISCMTAFALASPNRAVAEQLLLSNQKLKKKSVTRIVKNDKGEKKKVTSVINWLDWLGSKGYKDNRNHILASMAPFIARAITYLNKVGEPARVLCRFYANPELNLRSILGSYSIKELHGIHLDEPVNLFQLGGLLGFYDEKVISEINIKNFPYHHNAKLNIRLTVKLLRTLFCIPTTCGSNARDDLPFAKNHKYITLEQLQHLWIEYTKKCVPGFPYRYNKSGKKQKLEHTLFIFTGQQLASTNFRASSAYKFGNSHFAIETNNLGDLFRSALTPSKAADRSIFEEYGFSNNFKLAPNQFRHYLNTKGQQSGYSELTIAMFSGRNSVEQNATYDHTSDGEKVAKIAHIATKDDNSSKPIKVISQEKYESITNKTARSMSTGVCTQQLHQSPCTYLNDLLTQCVGCRSSCHINRDNESIDLLEKDLKVQESRLNNVKSNPNLNKNPLLKSWFLQHHRSVFILKNLIELMKSHDIKKGALIRYFEDESSFQLLDLDSQNKWNHKLTLPDSKKALDDILETFDDNVSPNINKELNNLLTSYGISI
ncbi:MAG: hypothetical protein ACI9YH_001912 [Colwellia sp.]